MKNFIRIFLVALLVSFVSACASSDKAAVATTEDAVKACPCKKDQNAAECKKGMMKKKGLCAGKKACPCDCGCKDGKTCDCGDKCPCTCGCKDGKTLCDCGKKMHKACPCKKDPDSAECKAFLDKCPCFKDKDSEPCKKMLKDCPCMNMRSDACKAAMENSPCKADRTSDACKTAMTALKEKCPCPPLRPAKEAKPEAK